MFPRTLLLCRTAVLLLALPTVLLAQKPPYDVFPDADPPYYRVRYEASTEPGELVFPVNYTIWIPKNVSTLRGVVVHQHGCGEGSCRSGLTGAFDLHWQALAQKHGCALLAPSYEQPEGDDCQLWCDPRHGSDAAFQKCLIDLGEKSGHPELAKVPWALWGHSGGGHWAGGMVLLHPERVAAAWLRSGVPLLQPNPERPTIKVHALPDAAQRVPLMCNLGTKEGVTVKDGRFAGVWPANELFFHTVRGAGGLIGVAVDPLTAHECGNQRYLAIPWLDACLSTRLPSVSGDPLKDMPTDGAWLAIPTGFEAIPAAKFDGDPLKAAWLPNEAIARSWMQYVKDTVVADTTPPPAPTALHVQGNELSWEADADLESGLAGFIIERDGEFLASVPEQAENPFGRPIFQNLQYSDTPTQPLVPMRFTDTKAEPNKLHTYRVIALNTLGLKSPPTADSVPAAGDRADEVGARDPFPEASPADCGIAVEAIGLLSDHVSRLVGQEAAVGAEIHIIKDRKTELHRAYGWADREERRPLETDAIYSVRSMTKPLVGTAIQMLIDAARAGIDFESGTSFQYSDAGSHTLGAIVSAVSGQPAAKFIRARILEPLGMHNTLTLRIR